ncbi:alpha/beta hydrolase [Periweissella fabalis]|uniref:Alpha/beta hydrolase n=1 Tax=Periweissella fabalis TaxID=1070421 RepID=A0A7X6S3G3_9LACO|nr:alpha/beta hydrolase [Periweissella fabalis]MCM0599652.1 alpha/beta hydrolase [Periweissella fabalis]NKZ23957.1 alpha/beta hydrolase [Periweissella fabalis]
MSKTRKIITWIVGIVAIIAITLVASSMYFFHVAEVRAPKTFIKSAVIKKNNPTFSYDAKFNKQHKEVWHQTTPGGLKLDAWYVANPIKTNKTVVIAHGFAGNKARMAMYGQMFLNLGYNVLIPDDRAAGQSDGNLIGFGWTDRKDYVRWINQVVEKNPQVEIAMFGVSMGGATTMMTAGEKLPNNVKVFIEDCGYDTVKNEIDFQAKSMYNLPVIPRFPLVDIVSGISKLRAGYTYGEASSVAQLHKNHLPMLFIHGGDDKFVPTAMAYKNYEATQGPKELWIVPGAAHAMSFEKNPVKYAGKVQSFLDRYFQ